jgi:hypothetical protein
MRYWVSGLVDVYEVSAVVAAAGVLIGVAYYIIDLRYQTKLKQMDFIMRMPANFLSKEVFQTLSTVMKTEFNNYEDFEGKAGIEARVVGGFCEDLGLLVKRKLVDITLVADRYDVRNVYEKLKPWIEETRKKTKDPRLYEWFEYLYNEMKKREQRK